MMKREFDELVGITTAPEAYERIEFVYMNCDEFQTKQQIADFYKEKDMNGIEQKYKEITEKILWEAEFRQLVEDVCFYSEGLVVEIRQHLLDKIYDIYKDKTLVRLFREYKVRYEEQQKRTLMDAMSYLKHGFEMKWKDDIIINAGHFRTVIASLTYDTWWHEQCRKESK